MILCIRDGNEKRFLEWSTISDGPASEAMTRTQMLNYLRTEYGRAREEEHERRVARAEEHGSSSRLGNVSAESETACNRAGPHETCLTFGAIVRGFVRGEEPNYHANAEACIKALRGWDHGEENHTASGDGPIVCVAIDPFHADGIEVVVTPNMVPTKGRQSFVIGAKDTPETVRTALLAAREALGAP